MNFEEYIFPIILAVIFLILLIVYYWYVRKIVLYILKKLGIESSSGYQDEDALYESTFRAIANISITDERWGRKILGYLIVVMFVLSVILLSIAFIILGAFLLGYF